MLQTKVVIDKQMVPQGRTEINSSNQTSGLPKRLKMTMNPTRHKHMISLCLITITMMAMTMEQTIKNQRKVTATMKVVMIMEMRVERTNGMNLLTATTKRRSQREAHQAEKQEE